MGHSRNYDVAKFLKTKGIIQEILELEELLKQNGIRHNEGIVSSREFNSIFSKPIFKGALGNVFAILGDKEKKEASLPMTLRILQYQRELYFSSINDKLPQVINPNNFKKTEKKRQIPQILQALQEYRLSSTLETSSPE